MNFNIISGALGIGTTGLGISMIASFAPILSCTEKYTIICARTEYMLIGLGFFLLCVGLGIALGVRD